MIIRVPIRTSDIYLSSCLSSTYVNCKYVCFTLMLRLCVTWQVLAPKSKGIRRTSCKWANPRIMSLQKLNWSWGRSDIGSAIARSTWVPIRVRSLLEHSCAILISFKIVIIFNTTSAKTKQSQLMLYWKWPQFWKKWGSCNCVLKMNGLFFFFVKKSRQTLQANEN